MIALQSLIERATRLNPTGVATTYKGTDVTWADTEHRVASLASSLQHLGLSEGDRVGILSQTAPRTMKPCLLCRGPAFVSFP